MRLGRSLVCLMVTTMLMGSAACSERTAPESAFVGEWSLVSYSNHGSVAQAEGTMVFRSDGTFSTEGLLSYPDNVTEFLAVDGAYRETKDGMVITIGTQSGTWTITRVSAVVTLTLIGPAPTNAIVMRR